ncbi:NAD-dependent succinate-semialdehyde dehydrogenase [Nocardioides sp. C4-1]|uniref:NAD-dependent succinate-semialdehyde dehydrogenase n=1 Tax=Nocardioides sp. C4-1 TaxID=3151851 RepID=UPI0032673CF2
MNTAEALALAPTRLLVGGRWRDAADGSTFDVEDPATGQVIASVASATPADGADALTAAADARRAWASVAPRRRSEILRDAFDLLTERRELFATLMTLEMGKPLDQARGEVTYGAEFFRWFSEEAVRIAGRWSVSPDGASRLLTMRQPVGPCLLITPWNFPLAMGTRKIGPAIAAGCTMVVKPAAQTPLTMLALAALLAEVGLPDGVLNVVPTSRTVELVEPLMDDERLRKVSFTGSTGVGRLLVRQSADQLLRTSMELGGNAPFLVFADADLDQAVDAAIIAKMRNMGEACTAANRFLVHDSVADEFAERLATRMAGETLGHGLDSGVTVGPLIDDRQLRAVADLVDGAVGAGARAVTGGARAEGPGHFYPPTVLVDVPADAPLLREEIFGPVAPVVRFADDDEAVTLANDTEFGLAAYVFTRDLARAHRVAEALEVGMVALNQGLVSNAAAPFGGVKSSGFGREGGAEGIEEYLEVKYVGLAL